MEIDVNESDIYEIKENACPICKSPQPPRSIITQKAIYIQCKNCKAMFILTEDMKLAKISMKHIPKKLRPLLF